MNLITLFKSLYGTEGRAFSSPGRINIIGEHTDYNDGFVLPAAIDKNIAFVVAENGTKNEVQVHSVHFQETVTFDLNNLKAQNKGDWQNYVIGIMAEMQNKGAVLQGFSCLFDGDIPPGSGLSSSAALECSLAFALNTLFNCGFNRSELAHIAQQAEHNFAGVQCGIMDQYASLFGKAEHVFQLDCRTGEKRYFQLHSNEHEWILINSKVKHSLANSEYNRRRVECDQGVAIAKEFFPEVSKLRDVNLATLNAISSKMPETIYQRCRYVIEENDRVLKATQCLESKNFEALGQLLYDSHHGLSKKYQVSCTELDFLVGQANEYGITGARMMGGGFGGCTLNFIQKDKIEGFLQHIRKRYFTAFQIEPEVYKIKICDGTKEVIEIPVN